MVTISDTGKSVHTLCGAITQFNMDIIETEREIKALQERSKKLSTHRDVLITVMNELVANHKQY